MIYHPKWWGSSATMEKHGNLMEIWWRNEGHRGESGERMVSQGMEMGYDLSMVKPLDEF